ncbi:MAG TPA: hypothetical protein H9841_11315 [Candidatus Flavonifractor merdigallinarum]|uniref:Uncharacterized protein n=1 Tax=Candidatus Flavonifractor merdigallinarum TaxID=2838589 RepID=A0A9D2C032_9FIRM|nr:hypothetical protein [Candidatus Flavonifractor merdigallinarum]
MRIAVCENTPAAVEQLQGWIEQYCLLYHIPADFQRFLSPEAFAAWKGRFELVFLGFGGSAGFLQARLLRERDHRCKIVLVDDTQQFAVQGVRIHCTDFILRPVEFRHIVRSMRLATGGGL